jgi:hypothetical protein
MIASLLQVWESTTNLISFDKPEFELPTLLGISILGATYRVEG